MMAAGRQNVAYIFLLLQTVFIGGKSSDLLPLVINTWEFPEAANTGLRTYQYEDFNLT